MAELTELQKQLFELQDIKYRDFHSKLMPETAKEKIIGIRTPVLRKFAKVFAGTLELEDFLQQLPHQFYEENNLHMMLITGIKDYPKCMEEVQRFLPYIDNWATCDFPEPKCFRKNKKQYWKRSGSGSPPLKPTLFATGSECLCAFFWTRIFPRSILKWQLAYNHRNIM